MDYRSPKSPTKYIRMIIYRIILRRDSNTKVSEIILSPSTTKIFPNISFAEILQSPPTNQYQLNQKLLKKVDTEKKSEFAPNGTLENFPNVTLDNTSTIIRPTFASFTPNRTFNFLRGVNPDCLIDKLAILLTIGIGLMKDFHLFGVKLIKCPLLHCIRQILVVLITILTIYYADKIERKKDVIVIQTIDVMFILLYAGGQNLAFFFVHKRINLKECWQSWNEALQAICMLYTFVGFLFHVYLMILCHEFIKECYPVGMILFGIIIFQLLFDGHVLQMLCPIAFFGSILLYIAARILISLWLCFDFVIIKRCEIMTMEKLIENRMKTIDKMLGKLSWVYSFGNDTINEQKESLCAICLESLEGEVVRLDCNNKHIFHKNCLYEWLTKINSCPICKQKIISDELYNIEYN